MHTCKLFLIIHIVWVFLIILIFFKQICVYYPSGKKTKLVSSQLQGSIRKSEVRGGDSEKTILENLLSLHPQLVTNRVAKIIMEASRDLCKKGSGSLLQTKDFQDVFEFKWNE